MDGLENNSEIIVIGATNRIDAIDPALRRPGRFDRELYFPLPCYTARKEILSVLKCKMLFFFFFKLSSLKIKYLLKIKDNRK